MRPTLRIGLLGVALSAVGLVACATPKLPTTSAAEAFGGAPVSTATPLPDGGVALVAPPVRPRVSLEPWARGFVRAGECLGSVRVLVEQQGRAAAWPYMKACAARPDYGLLQSLLDEWLPELKSKPEGAGVIAQVIANRGGGVGADLQVVQRKRLPIFELAAALSHPEAHQGRYLVFVGRIDRFKSARGRHEMLVMQRARGSDESRVFSGQTLAINSTAPGAVAINSQFGSFAGSLASGGSITMGMQEARVTATFEDTGQEVITRLTAADPFLAVNRSFVFLVRFDGAKRLDTDDSSEEEEPRTAALVSLISYHPLNEGGTVAW